MITTPGFKLSYVVLLAKPSTCKTWLPWTVKGRHLGNFFVDAESALEYARKLVSTGPRKYLYGTKQVDLWEFTLGYVMRNDPPHIIRGPLPEPKSL